MTPLLIIAICKALNMLSIVLSLVGVYTVVTGLFVHSGVSPLRAVHWLLIAMSTNVDVIDANVSGVKPANHVVGVAVPIKLASTRSVSGVTFTVPKLVAIE